MLGRASTAGVARARRLAIPIRAPSEQKNVPAVRLARALRLLHDLLIRLTFHHAPPGGGHPVLRLVGLRRAPAPACAAWSERNLRSVGKRRAGSLREPATK